MNMVYVPQKPSRRNRATGEMEYTVDLSPAEAYGKIEILMGDKQSTLLPGLMRDEMRSKLQKFNDNDHIIPIGPPAALANAIMIAAQQNHGKVKILQWDRLEKRYISIQLTT